MSLPTAARVRERARAVHGLRAVPPPPEDRAPLARIRASHPFDQRPLLAVWAVTRTCSVGCEHGWHDGDLTTDEGEALIKRIASMGTPHLVLAGGDPAVRGDLEHLVAAGVSAGMTVAIACESTPRMSNDRLASLALAGVTRIAVSLNGPDATLHDAQVSVGSFAHTIRIVEEAHALGLAVQVETTLGPHNYAAVEAIAQKAHALGATHWAVHASIPKGREREDLAQEGDTLEQVLHHVAEISERGYFEVRVTHAPHFRRILMQRRSPEAAAGILRDVDGRGRVRGPRGVGDGVGFLFVSHAGDVFPSAMLPLRAGNVRSHDVVTVYRESPLFRALRDATQLVGKCGECPFRGVCGGSRARAWTVTGDLFEADPFCTYRPREWTLLRGKGRS